MSQNEWKIKQKKNPKSKRVYIKIIFIRNNNNIIIKYT